MPEIFVVGLTTTIAALKVFAPVYVLTTGGPGSATMVPSYLAYYHFFTTNPGRLWRGHHHNPDADHRRARPDLPAVQGRQSEAAN